MGRLQPFTTGRYRPKADVVNPDNLPLGERHLHLWKSKLLP